MMNDIAADSPVRPSFWKRILAAFGVGMLLFAALMFYPPAYESARMLLARPLPRATASDASTSVPPSAARRQQISDARTVVHGTYIKDPYGCVYMVEYIAAKLSLSPVLDNRQRQVCSSQ